MHKKGKLLKLAITYTVLQLLQILSRPGDCPLLDVKRVTECPGSFIRRSGAAPVQDRAALIVPARPRRRTSDVPSFPLQSCWSFLRKRNRYIEGEISYFLKKSVLPPPQPRLPPSFPMVKIPFRCISDSKTLSVNLFCFSILMFTSVQSLVI